MTQVEFETERRADVVTGIFKFSEAVGENPLLSVACEWKANDPGFVQLHIRGCSRNQLGIGFEYHLLAGDTQKKFVYRMTDQLRRRFGNDLVGWDLASPVTMIVGETSKQNKIFVRLEPSGDGFYAQLDVAGTAESRGSKLEAIGALIVLFSKELGIEIVDQS